MAAQFPFEPYIAELNRQGLWTLLIKRLMDHGFRNTQNY
jgi:hypothetical protein